MGYVKKCGAGEEHPAMIGRRSEGRRRGEGAEGRRAGEGEADPAGRMRGGRLDAAGLARHHGGGGSRRPGPCPAARTAIAPAENRIRPDGIGPGIRRNAPHVVTERRSARCVRPQRTSHRRGRDPRRDPRMGPDRIPVARRCGGQPDGGRDRVADAAPYPPRRAHPGTRRLRGLADRPQPLGRGGAGHPRAEPRRHRPPDRDHRRDPAGAPGGRSGLRPRHLRHEGRRVPRLVRLSSPRAERTGDPPSHHLPLRPGGGGREPHFPPSDRAGRPHQPLRAGHRTGPRRRPHRHRAQGGGPVRDDRAGPAVARGRSARGGPKRDQGDGAPDSAPGGPHRLRVRG